MGDSGALSGNGGVVVSGGMKIKLAVVGRIVVAVGDRRGISSISAENDELEPRP